MPFYYPGFDPARKGLDSHADVSWLEQFVCEIRPFLLAHCATALNGLRDWLASIQEEEQRHRAIKRKRLAYLFLSWINDWDQSCQASDDWVPLDGWISKQSVHVVGWGPREISPEFEPGIDSPLPLPNNRELRLFECWAVMIAVHDITRVSSERIKQNYLPFCDEMTFVVLCGKAAKLSARQLPYLQKVLRRLEESVATTEMNDDNSIPTKPQANSFHGSALVTAADLANECHVDKGVMNSALSKFAKTVSDCREKIENPKPREPKFVYRRELVEPLIKRYKERERERETETPMETRNK